MRLIPTKKDIAFVEYMDEGSATVAKDALHNYKLDGENKIKVCLSLSLQLICAFGLTVISVDYIRKKVIVLLAFFGYLVCTVLYF